VENPGYFGSQGNRLTYERRWQPYSQIPLPEERWYLYDVAGRVTYVVQKLAAEEDASGPWYRGTQVYYNNVGQVSMSKLLKWQYDGEGGVINETPLAAMEYRYDSGRRRYLTRPVNANPPPLLWREAGEKSFRDYSGEDIYRDYVAGPVIPSQGSCPTHNQIYLDYQTAHEPGMGQFDPTTQQTRYVYGNLIGTTERMTSLTAGNQPDRAVLTAFGERVWADPGYATRYGYVGAWGYEAAETGDPLEELGWLHVGARYYDPSSGRFVQRDPIGIEGGLSVYQYVMNEPNAGVDPTGLLYYPPVFPRFGFGGRRPTTNGPFPPNAGSGFFVIGIDRSYETRPLPPPPDIDVIGVIGRGLQRTGRTGQKVGSVGMAVGACIFWAPNAAIATGASGGAVWLLGAGMEAVGDLIVY